MYRAVACLLLVTAGPAAAQLDRRDRDEPEMFLNLDGRTGTCDVMLFSKDGRTLYAGGDDKVVRSWPVGRAGLETGRLRTLRWPAWREQRGGIKTLAVPDQADGRVFVGGYGLKSGAVVLFEKDGQIIATTDREGIDTPDYPAMASAFTPDGKGVIYGTSDGRIYHWDLAAKNVEVGRHVVASGKTFNRPRLIRFFKRDGADVFLSVAESGEVLFGTATGAGWTVSPMGTVMDAFAKAFPAGRPPRPLPEYSVFRADLSADGACLACSVQPNYLVLVPLQPGPAKIEKVDFVVRSVAWDQAGRLAVGVTTHNNQNLYQVDGDDRIFIYDDPLKGAAPVRSAEIKHTGRAEYMAWGRNDVLAVAGGDNHEVRLYDGAPGGKAKPGPIQTVRGLGRGLWQVRLGKAGNTFEFRAARTAGGSDPNEVGAGDWHAYDFAGGKPVPATPKDQVAVRITADGWTVAPTNDPLVWEAVHKDGVRKPLPLDPNRDDQPRCYCFIPATGVKPTRLLVGHYYGFSAFDLDVSKPAVRTILATGHAGDVTSIATDADGTWAITASGDMTLAGWSLADWPSGGLGAQYAIGADGKLMVAEVDVGGPAYEMGLTKGDEIVMVSKNQWPPQFARAGTYLSGKRQTTFPADLATPAAGKTALDNPVPGVEHYLAWKRAGQVANNENATSFRRRPLWRFFPAFDEQNRLTEWIAWVWKTGHYATSTNGDTLIGWQLNDPTTISGKRPELIEASQLKKPLERRLAVRRLMITRDLAATLKELAGDNPQALKFGAREPHPVRLKLDAPAVGPTGVPVEISVAAQGRNPDLIPDRVEVWVNDHRVNVWDKLTEKSFAQKLTIPADDFRAGDNQVAVLTFNRAGGRGEVKGTINNPRPEEKNPRLLALMVGINDYSQAGTPGAKGEREFGNLKVAVKDAQELGSKWQVHTGKDKFYGGGNVLMKLGKEAYQKDILAALDDVAKTARADDRVVIFLAGHGMYVKNPDAPAGSEEHMFVYCCPDFHPGKIATTGVTGKQIVDRLARCKGRQLILLDACHSGGVAAENVIRSLVPDGQGPTVLASCDQNEKSYENPTVGNGLFTKAVMDALDPKNVGESLDPKGLFVYIRDRMPRLLKDAGLPDGLQNPVAFPAAPFLARYKIAGK